MDKHPSPSGKSIYCT